MLGKPESDVTFTSAQDCVCRVCVAYEFYAFHAFHAIIESVSYGRMEGLKVQVPPPASRNLLHISKLEADFFGVCARTTCFEPHPY